MSQVVIDPNNPRQAIVADGTDERFGIHVGSVVLGNIHSAELCQGHNCVIHNPSDHHMRSWPLTWRGDKGVFERQCPHGVGHPDPDDGDYLISVGRGDWTIHGCDGCCWG